LATFVDKEGNGVNSQIDKGLG